MEEENINEIKKDLEKKIEEMRKELKRMQS